MGPFLSYFHTLFLTTKEICKVYKRMLTELSLVNLTTNTSVPELYKVIKPVKNQVSGEN